MSEKILRNMVVDNEAYLWVVKNHWRIWQGKLVVYFAKTKAGRLEVTYDSIKYFEWRSPKMQIVDEQNPTRILNINEPEPTSRIIRYARRELAWNPNESKAPLIIEDGFELLKKLGYVAKPIKTES